MVLLAPVGDTLRTEAAVTISPEGRVVLVVRKIRITITGGSENTDNHYYLVRLGSWGRWRPGRKRAVVRDWDGGPEDWLVRWRLRTGKDDWGLGSKGGIGEKDLRTSWVLTWGRGLSPPTLSVVVV